MPVHRMTHLPEGPGRGQLIVPAGVVDATVSALRSFRGRYKRHEGLVFWAGRVVADTTLVLTAVVPYCDHSRGRVVADENGIGDAARRARALRLGLVAQVHSHPGTDTRHSDGDDRLVLMPIEGMFSIVCGNYGDDGLAINSGVGVHQVQDGHWVRINPLTEQTLCVLPGVI